MTSPPRIRQAVRAVVLDPSNRVLLVRFDWSNGDGVWATPGGGIEPGEDPDETLRRELAEETGLRDADVGPVIWTRTHLFPFEDGSHDGQAERYHLVRTEAFEPAPGWSWERLGAESITGIRWWALDELLASDDRFAPTRLPRLIAALIESGPPGRAVDVGV